MKKFLAFVLAATIIGSGYYYYQQETQSRQAAGQGTGGGNNPTAVSVMKLSKKKIAIRQTLPGRISPFRQAEVRPQVNGVIVERLFEEGSLVKKGDRLYQISDTRFKAALASAEADLAGAKANAASVGSRAERYRKLVKANAVSKQEYDDAMAENNRAKAAVSVAEASLKLAQVNVEYSKVYAPISGRIGRSFVTEGALATANQTEPLAVITQLDPIYVDVQQSGEDAMRLRKKLRQTDAVPVTLELGKGGGYGEKGMLKFSETTVDESTGAVTMRAVFANPDEILLPGLFVKATLTIDEKTALVVPQRAAMRTPDGKLVAFVVNAENVVARRPFTASDAHEDGWVVESGIEDGETIIVEGYQKVKDGQTVSTTPYIENNAK